MWSLLQEQVTLFGEQQTVEQGTHHAAALSTGTGPSICPDRATEHEQNKAVLFCVCVGLCQEMVELSGMRCFLHSLAVGVSIMRVTEACLCVG